MLLDASEMPLSSQTLLWLVGSTIAAVLLFGSMNRRRSRLIDSLRDYVDRNLKKSDASKSPKDDSSPGEAE
ncbi:MAG: hypothetical protein MI861_17420 [Pirellulales bacterium]|nr:hypothetical protein [Pirellulales bacterium]